MKKFNDPIEKGADWLRGTEEGEKRWVSLLKVVVGALGFLGLIYMQLPPHLKAWWP